MTTEAHMAGLEQRIKLNDELADEFERLANAVTGNSKYERRARTNLIHSATSRRADAMKCRGILATLKAEKA